MKLLLQRCDHCGYTLFPARYLCPVCGGAAWSDIECTRGTVAESTVVRQRTGDVSLASVSTDEGPIVIAMLDTPLPDGARVSLSIDETARISARAIHGDLNAN